MRISDWSSDVCSSDLHGLLDVVTNCPNPGLILSRYRTVIAYNKAFGEWLGPANVAVIGAELTTLVQVRTRRSLNDVWQDLVSGREPSADAKLLYVAPGRVNAAQATILALRSPIPQEFYAVMWLSLQSRRAGGDRKRLVEGKRGSVQVDPG